MMIGRRLHSISTDRIGDDIHDLCDVRSDELSSEDRMEWIIGRKRMSVSMNERRIEWEQKTK